MDRHPAEAFPPPDFILEEIEAQGLSQELARFALGWDSYAWSCLQDRTLRIDERRAADLARVLGPSPEYWLALQAAYASHRDVTADIGRDMAREP